VPLSCRVTQEQSQRLSQQADAAGLDLSEYLRTLIFNGSAATERALEAARRETDHATRVEKDQEIQALRTQLDHVYDAYLGWKARALELEKNRAFSSSRFMDALGGVLWVKPGYRAQLLQWLDRMPPDDRPFVFRAAATRVGEWLEGISEQTSTDRVDIRGDRSLLRGVEWLVRILGPEVESSDKAEARLMEEWQSVTTGLEAAKKAIEKRSELAGGSR
jgi:hypothetical protein